MASSAQPTLPARSHQENKVWAIQVAFLAVLCVFYMVRGIFPSIEALFAFCVVFFGYKARFRGLLRDLIPFFVLLLSYQALRGFADDLTPFEVHVHDLLGYERALFGGIVPAAWVQAQLADASWAPYLTYPATVVYVSHFVTPVFAAILLWHFRKRVYWSFVIAFLIVTYAGFLTYLLYPACPPWLAHTLGVLKEPVVMQTLRGLIEFAGPNPVAAMPSLHMAYPTLIAGFLLWQFGRKAAPILILPPAMALATVVLGHHYVVDLIAGAGYALVSFTVVFFWHRRNQRSQPPENQGGEVQHSPATPDRS